MSKKTLLAIYFKIKKVTIFYYHILYNLLNNVNPQGPD